MNCTHCLSSHYSINVTCANCGIIYKALPNWVGLTDEEIINIWAGVSTGYDDEINIVHLGKAIEAKLKEKNA